MGITRCQRCHAVGNIMLAVLGPENIALCPQCFRGRCWLLASELRLFLGGAQEYWEQIELTEKGRAEISKLQAEKEEWSQKKKASKSHFKKPLSP